MTGLDHAVGYDDEVDKPDAGSSEIQESLLRGRDGQALAKRGLR